MQKLAALNRQIDELKVKEALIRKGKLEIFRRKLLRCLHCNKKSQLLRWGFVQDHWYERPRGCTGGDHWHNTETGLCHVVCPDCNEMNCLCNHHKQADIVLACNTEHFSPDELFARVFDQYGDSEPKLRDPRHEH